MSNPYIIEIDRIIDSKSMLQHPFYQAWSKGELSQKILADYAAQYYHHVSAFPTYLSAVHSVTDDITTRRLILENLVDEEAGNPNHPDFWLMFAGTLGVSETEIQSTVLYPQTKALIDHFRQTCRKGTIEGLTALYCYESQIPAVSESKIKGLKEFYGIESYQGLAYFKVHIEADKMHSAVERERLEHYITELTFPVAVRTAETTTDALYGILDGICQRNGIDC